MSSQTCRLVHEIFKYFACSRVVFFLRCEKQSTMHRSSFKRQIIGRSKGKCPLWPTNNQASLWQCLCDRVQLPKKPATLDFLFSPECTSPWWWNGRHSGDELGDKTPTQHLFNFGRHTLKNWSFKKISCSRPHTFSLSTFLSTTFSDFFSPSAGQWAARDLVQERDKGKERKREGKEIKKGANEEEVARGYND